MGGRASGGRQTQPGGGGTEAAGLGPAKDAQSNAPTKVTYQYKSSATGQFQPYDPANPPQDVATTTTDQGRTVPYVVRVEEGTQDRGLYEIAVLRDGWNNQLLVPFGANTAPHHSQDAP